jgi:predicted nucleotidyltransferase
MCMFRTLDIVVNKFAALPQVEGVLLAGSLTSHTSDEFSDIDLYIYTSSEISLKQRQEIFEPLVEFMEYGNQFWELEDDGHLKEPNMDIEVIYRSTGWMERELQEVVLNYRPSVGYSTCFWGNFTNSNILFDRNGLFKKLQESFSVPYPKQLKRNIIEKNYPLLQRSMCSYYAQIKKALMRNDFVSINHRVAAFLASYFDIIFAVNEMPHPGEKKLVKIVSDRCSIVPEQFGKSMERILLHSAHPNDDFLSEISQLVSDLDTLLENNGYCLREDAHAHSRANTKGQRADSF